jgi:hypothetical protein
MRLSFKRIGKLPVLGEALRHKDALDWRFGLQTFLKTQGLSGVFDPAHGPEADRGA